MTSKKFSDVLWVFSHATPKIIPSYLVGGIMPADLLGIRKIIFLENHDPLKTLNLYKPKILIIPKAFHQNIYNLIKVARKNNIKIISVFDDWNFDLNSKTDNTKRNIPIAKDSDLRIVKTNTASEILFENTSLDSMVIPDSIRFPSSAVFNKIIEPFRICWFGMHSNHDTLLNELANIDKVNMNINLKIITNYSHNLKNIINNLGLKHIKFEYIEWHPNFNKDVISSEIVLLPYPNDKERLVKSSNRIIDSLNLGRFVILSDVKQFNEFKDYVFFGKISSGLVWLKNNPLKAKEIVVKGQRYVQEKYSPKCVSLMWAKAINKLL